MTPHPCNTYNQRGGHNWGFTPNPIFVELTEKNLLGYYLSYDPPPNFSYGMPTHFVKQQKFFNLSIKKIFLNKIHQKLRDPQNKNFV